MTSKKQKQSDLYIDQQNDVYDEALSHLTDAMVEIGKKLQTKHGVYGQELLDVLVYAHIENLIPMWGCMEGMSEQEIEDGRLVLITEG